MPSKFLEPSPFGHTYTSADVGQRFSQRELILSALLIPIGDLNEHLSCWSKLLSRFLSCHDGYMIRASDVKAPKVCICNTQLHSPAFSSGLSLPFVQISSYVDQKRNERNDQQNFVIQKWLLARHSIYPFASTSLFTARMLGKLISRCYRSYTDDVNKD